MLQRKKDQEEDAKTQLPQVPTNRKLSLLHFKSILHLAFQKNAWWLSVCNSSHPQPFLLGCASGEVQPRAKLGQHLGPPGLPSLWNAKENSEAFWHQLPVLSPHAPTVAASFATQTFFALTPNFPAAKNLLPTEHIPILFCSPSQLNPHPSPCSSTG